MESLGENINPFSPDLDPEKLYCFTNGVALKADIAADLLGMYSTGEKWMKEFTAECKENPARFEQTVKKQQVKNFTADGMKVTAKGKELKIIELKFTRDLFAQILFQGQNQSISLQHILTYPLTPAPLSMAHINGAMCVTNKAALVHKIEAKVTPVSNVKCEAVIIDFMFFIRSATSDLPVKYGALARSLLTRVPKRGATTVMFIADIYNDQHSVKDSCQGTRGTVSGGRTYSKLKHGQTRPSNFSTALKSRNFINALLEFLRDEWSSERCADLITGHILHFAYGPCYTYTVCLLMHCNSVIFLLASMMTFELIYTNDAVSG